MRFAYARAKGSKPRKLNNMRTPPKASITAPTDIFGLKGAAEAFQAIGKACGLECTEDPAPKSHATAIKHH